LADALYRHLNNLGLLDASLTLSVTLVHAVVGDQSAEVSETGVDAISSALLNDAMRLRVLHLRKKYQQI